MAGVRGCECKYSLPAAYRYSIYMRIRFRTIGFGNFQLERLPIPSSHTYENICIYKNQNRAKHEENIYGAEVVL